MKLNQDKGHLIISGCKADAIWAKIGQTKIWVSKRMRLLGAITDHKLNFDVYLILLCKKVKRFSKTGKLFKLRTKETFNEKFY